MMMASKLFVNANLFFKEIRNMSFHITNELIDQYLNRYFYESIERLNAQIEKSHQFDYAFYTLKEEYEDQTDFIKRTENIKQRKLYPFMKVGNCLLTQGNTENTSQPDFKGDVTLNHETLQRLLDESNGRDIKLHLGAWIKDSKWDDKQMISCQFSTNELSNETNDVPWNN